LATVYAIEENRKDVEELTKIVIEDKIPKVQIHNVFFPIKNSFVNHWSTDKVLEEYRNILTNKLLLRKS
jgi:hypothetical protein